MSIICPLCFSNQTETYISLDYCVASNAMKVEEPVDVYLCHQCVSLFKKYQSDTRAQKIITEINEESTLHEEGGAVETRVAYDKYSEGIPKSDYIFEYLNQYAELSNSGELLDIGCHFGAFLKAFTYTYPHWNLTGCDVSDRFKSSVEGISDKVTYIDNNLPKSKHGYDVISMSHVLEHIENIDYLFEFISQNLKDDGLFFLQCNNAAQNPFLLLVFEQYYNFTETSIERLCERFGLSIERITKNWINKELTILIRKKQNNHLPKSKVALSDKNLTALVANQDFFVKTVDTLQSNYKSQAIALFGTTYAAKWFSYLPNLKINNFVDENPELINSMVDDKKVLSPLMNKSDIPIILTFPLPIAEKIKQRLQPLIDSQLIIPAS